jgi:hypothetical protein
LPMSRTTASRKRQTWSCVVPFEPTATRSRSMPANATHLAAGLAPFFTSGGAKWGVESYVC